MLIADFVAKFFKQIQKHKKSKAKASGQQIAFTDIITRLGHYYSA